MRTSSRLAIVALGFVALTSAGLAAQAPAHQHSFVPAHKQRLSIDFGTKQALKRFAQRPVDCGKVTHRRHEPLPIASSFVELPFYGGHGHRPVPVAPCPVR